MDDKKIEAAIKTMAESAARILCDVVLEIIKSAPPADSAQPPAPEQECSVLENYLRMCNPQEARDWGRSSEGHTCGGEIRLWPQEICGLCGDGPIKNPGCAVVPGSNTLLPGVRGDAEAAPSIVDDGGAHVSAKIVEQIKSMSGDTEVAAPRRSWKRWACYDEMGELAEIEREAYRLGEKYGHDNGYAEAMRDMRGSTTPQPIGGVTMAGGGGSVDGAPSA